MACYGCPPRLPVGQGLDPYQATNHDVQTNNRKRKPQKRNDEISSKSQKKTTGGARTPSNRSARDSVQAHGLTHDLSKSVPRKELAIADGSIDDHSSKFSKESSSSLSLSSSSSNDLSSNDEHNQDEESDDNASSEVWATKNVDGLEINLERFHDPNIEILPLDKKCCPNCTTRTSFSQKTSFSTQFETFCFSTFDLPPCLYLFPMTWPCIS
jgi:hypothetical protein